jgi:dihydrofolate reductase
MKAIVAVDQHWGIGKEGSLLVHLPGDLQYFKQKTLGKVVVMGRSTLESIPGAKPLPNRTNIILSTTMDFQPDCIVCRSKSMLFEELKRYKMEDVYIIGGERVYKDFLSYCDTVFVTKIAAVFPADKYFENLDEKEDWHMVYEGEAQEEKGFSYRFTEYKRIP